jgi:hypothetical protein
MGMSFNGSSQYRESPWLSTVQRRALTCRFRMSSYPTGSGTTYIFGSIRNSPIFQSKFAIMYMWDFTAIPIVNKIRGEHRLGFSTIVVDSNVAPATNFWNEVLFTHTSVKIELRLWNGTTLDYNSTADTNGQDSLIDKLAIGRHPQGYGYYEGDICELSAYNYWWRSNLPNRYVRADQRERKVEPGGAPYKLIHYIRGCAASDPIDFTRVTTWSGTTGVTDHPYVGNVRYRTHRWPAAAATRRVGIGGCFADSADVKLAG